MTTRRRARPADPPIVHLTPLDALYPSRLRTLERPPPYLSTRGGALEAPCVVAIVGARDAHRASISFARGLARTLIRAGAVVVSGGALGIDGAAHRGALDAGGRTWAVPGCGCEQCFPPQHSSLFRAIGAGPGAMLWPFEPSAIAKSAAFLTRNRILVALSDAVVVVQAGARSGALHSAGCARKLGRPLWVVPTAPWVDGFEGSKQLLQHGARPLDEVSALLGSLGLASPDAANPSIEFVPPALSPQECSVFAATTSSPLHLDELALRAHVSVHAVAASLLTLVLENVVVEGPPGFFRRR